jgi:replicative superfamily II helicase
MEDAIRIVSIPWERNVLFNLTTSGGKSIAIDFLVAARSAAHIKSCKPNVVCGVLIVAVPTIALATETHVRLQHTWQYYSDTRYDIGDHPTLDKFPPIHTYKRNGTHQFYPLIKLFAGVNSTENLFLTIRENGDATSEATKTRKIPFVIVATYEHVLGLIHKWHEPLDTGFNTTYGDHIKYFVMDEAHYATESDRTAPHALVR